MFYLEKAFLPLFAFIALISGLVFGSVIPILFLVIPILAMPLLMYCYTQVYKYRYRQLASDESPLDMLQDSISTKVVDLDDRRTYVQYAFKEKDKERLINDDHVQSAQTQIADITARKLGQLTEQMPSNGSVTQHFTAISPTQWMYRFHFKSVGTEFNAVGVGSQPTEAFAVAKQVLQKQIREWHVARERGLDYVGEANNEILDNLKSAQGSTASTSQVATTAASAPIQLSTPQVGESSFEDYARKHQPTVLIVEDDPDVASATASIFKQLGCKTIISDGHDGASHKMSFQDVDFIVLDWMLGDNLSADQLVKKSSRIIDAFKDLKSRFQSQHAKIITYSALDRSKVHLPDSKYFDHLDHWQKPVRYNELAKRASDLLVANGY